MFKRILAAMLVAVSLLALCGCDETNIKYENSIKATKDNGEEYTILNPNYFRFDTYNVLEVIVSEDERFVFHDTTPNDDRESGPGLWYRNGVVANVWMFNDGGEWRPDGLHGDLIVELTYPWGYGEYCVDPELLDFAPTKNHRDDVHSRDYIACIKNDSDHPGLQWYVDGTNSFNVRFSEEITPVEYKTHTLEDAYRKLTLPRPVYQFYTIEKETIATYSCEEAGFQWDGATGKGTWEYDGKTIPISVTMDESYFTLEVTCDTEDEFTGTLLYSAKGKSINETTAIYEVVKTPHVLDPLKTITVQRTNG